MKDAIRRVIQDNVKISGDSSALSDTDDLYVWGMTSHASVMLMLALENEFGVEFSDAMLTRDVFASINSIAEAICLLQLEAA